MPENFELFVLIFCWLLTLCTGIILALRLIWKIWTHDFSGSKEYWRLTELINKANAEDVAAQKQCGEEPSINKRRRYKEEPVGATYYVIPTQARFKPFKFF